MALEKQDILVVDLDGTLLRSDMLFETFWSAFGSDWRIPFSVATSLSAGRAALKRRLAAAAHIDAATLPYDPDVISYIEAWRKTGGRTALVTASDQAVAEAVAGHLGIFDEVHGSDGSVNLKGDRKAGFLQKRFGAQGFAYMGDSAADLPVWSRAAKAITVNVPAALRRKAEQVCAKVEHLATIAPSPLSYAKALRPHQWLKNTLVFLPMLAAHQLDAAMFLIAFLAFVSFSLIASSVYVLNDLLDLAADRAHPRKKNRPFAAGSIPIAHGTAMAILLCLLGMLAAILIGWKFLLVMIGYSALTTAYSLHLKRRIIVDICVLAGLYTIRIVAGGVATENTLSVWLLAFSIFFFLSLAAVKRQAELVDSARRGKLTSVGRGYNVDDLPMMPMIAIGAGYVSVLVMVLYTSSPAVADRYARPEALWGVAAVLIYWITRTVMVAHRGQMNDDPVIYAAKDRVSQICLLVILACVAAGMVS